jgi:hypothetical protein
MLVFTYARSAIELSATHAALDEFPVGHCGDDEMHPLLGLIDWAIPQPKRSNFLFIIKCLGDKLKDGLEFASGLRYIPAILSTTCVERIHRAPCNLSCLGFSFGAVIGGTRLQEFVQH